MKASTRHKLFGLSPCGFHTISYQLWQTEENDQNRHIICVHGLTRNSHDFDKLAAHLSEKYTLACPDIVGRGQSSWLPVYDHYDYPQYLADMNALYARLNVKSIDWIGTSMGGLIGMMFAAMPNSPIQRLVINDVGPILKRAALERIGNYTGVAPPFESEAEAESYLRKIHAPFHPMTDQDWQEMTARGLIKGEDGKLRLNYDPKIGTALRTSLTGTDVNLWQVYDAIKCPTLVIRGANSDLLDKPTATEMTKRGPKASLVEIEGAGHAPSLLSIDQIEMIENWLETTQLKSQKNQSPMA
jgi:pimeloyl-ACP methyl ester carboxylesterase